MDASSMDMVDIRVVIGGGGFIKPDNFRKAFILIRKSKNNIHNHLKMHDANEFCNRLKNNILILPPISFIIPNKDEDKGKTILKGFYK